MKLFEKALEELKIPKDFNHKFDIDSNTYTCEQNIYHQPINKNTILEKISCKWFIDGTNGFNVAKSYINEYLCKKN